MILDAFQKKKIQMYSIQQCTKNTGTSQWLIFENRLIESCLNHEDVR